MILIKYLIFTLLAIIANSEKRSTDNSELPLSLLELTNKNTAYSKQYNNNIQEYYNYYYKDLFENYYYKDLFEIEKGCVALTSDNPAYNPYHSSLIVNSKEGNIITVLGNPIEINKKNVNSENECGTIQNMNKQSISCHITLPNNTTQIVEFIVPDNQCYNIRALPIYSAKVNLWSCNYNNNIEISKNVTTIKINNYVTYLNHCDTKTNNTKQITLNNTFNERTKGYTLSYSEALKKGEYVSSPGGRWHFGLLPNGELALCENEFKESHIKWSNGINYLSKYDLKFFIDINGHLVVTAKNIVKSLDKNDHYDEKTNSITKENKLNKRIEEKNKDQVSANSVEDNDSLNKSYILEYFAKFKEWLKNYKSPENKSKIYEIGNVIQNVNHKSDKEIIVWDSLPRNLTYNVGYFGDSGYFLVLSDDGSKSKNSPVMLYDGAGVKIWQILPTDEYKGYPFPREYDMPLDFETTTSSNTLTSTTPVVGDIPIYTNLTSTTIISINDNITTKIDKITTKSHKDIYLPSQTRSSSSISGISIPTIMSSNKCGTYDDGIYVCKNNKCCSKYGHCGDTEKYCGKGCQNNYGLCYSKSSRCGIEYGICNNNKCCSKYGYCGNGKKYCYNGCQSEFGKCM